MDQQTLPAFRKGGERAYLNHHWPQSMLPFWSSATLGDAVEIFHRKVSFRRRLRGSINGHDRWELVRQAVSEATSPLRSQPQ